MSGLGSRRAAAYQKLPGAQTRRGEGRSRSSTTPLKRAWVVLRKVAVKVVVCYVGRRRRAVAAAWARLRRAAGLGGVGRRVMVGYDTVSYERNFDDGRWKEEDEEYWRSGSFASRFGSSGHLGTLGLERPR